MATSRIFVRGLPPNLTEADFRKHFSANNREVTDVKLIPQRRIGYVGYKTPDDASNAVKYFHKSYVRMSRIAVEPARPISDSIQSKHSTARDLAGTSAKRKAHETTTNASDSPKKRKRDELDPSDPKLKEFLRVMGSSKEKVFRDDPMDVVDAGPTRPQPSAVEGESDDEYEQLPSGKKTQNDTAASRIDRHVLRPLAVTNAAKDDAQDITGSVHKEAKVPNEEAVEVGADHAPEATDDDWLRSRTNRLLDLMDPDDIVPTQPGQIPVAPVEQNNEGPSITEPSHSKEADDTSRDNKESDEQQPDDKLDTIRRTSRLFVRNLPYSTKEEDIRESFEKFGTIEEVHIPTNKAGTGKGFALVLFEDASQAVEAYQSMDGATFQGRLIHIIPASAKRDTGLDEFEISKLPLKKQNMIRKKAESASNTFNWNSLYMSQDAVNASVATRLGVSKAELLDPTSADAAVKQAIAETSVIQETKAYFMANGVDLDAFKSHKRGDTAILVKNFPYGTTIDEIRTLFEESGSVLRVLMPPSGTIAIVQFAQANQAKAAFGKLAYRRVKDSVLFLEKAPKDLFVGGDAVQVPQLKDRSTGAQKLNVDELLSRGDEVDNEVDTTSLFVRNLNFDTTTDGLAEAFKPLDGFVAARVKTKMDPKKPGQTLSMGFGFVEFRTKSQAQEALKAMNGFVLNGHTLAVKASHRGLDAAEERKREDKAKKAAGQRTKIIIKNLPFQTTKKDVRALFGTYGQLRSVRVPKKADYTARGFAFADFITPREAENALNSLRDTHLLGRRLVLDFAEAEAADAEEEIAKMQRKVGGQVNKVALQQLTGGGRKKVNIGNNEDELEG